MSRRWERPRGGVCIYFILFFLFSDFFLSFLLLVYHRLVLVGSSCCFSSSFDAPRARETPWLSPSPIGYTVETLWRLLQSNVEKSQSRDCFFVPREIHDYCFSRLASGESNSRASSGSLCSLSIREPLSSTIYESNRRSSLPCSASDVCPFVYSSDLPYSYPTDLFALRRFLCSFYDTAVDPFMIFFGVFFKSLKISASLCSCELGSEFSFFARCFLFEVEQNASHALVCQNGLWFY